MTHTLLAPTRLARLEQWLSLRNPGASYGTIIRVDLYATAKGTSFGEFSSTPDQGRGGTRRSDGHLGNLRQRSPTSYEIRSRLDLECEVPSQSQEGCPVKQAGQVADIVSLVFRPAGAMGTPRTAGVDVCEMRPTSHQLSTDARERLR